MGVVKRNVRFGWSVGAVLKRVWACGWWSTNWLGGEISSVGRGWRVARLTSGAKANQTRKARKNDIHEKWNELERAWGG